MIKLTQLIKESSEEKRPLSNEVKKHFLEIVSTYNKYQESLDRKSDIQEIAETLGGITEAARTLAIHESDDWFDKHTVKRNMSELDKLGKQFDKCASEAKSLDQRLGGLYEDMGNILSRYYKMGEITEDQMKERLGMTNESKSDCGCGCGGVTEGGCSTNITEISAKKGLEQVIKGNTKEIEGTKLSIAMARAMKDWYLNSPYGRKYPESIKAPIHISFGIMMSFGLERYIDKIKHKDWKKELAYIKGLSKRK